MVSTLELLRRLAAENAEFILVGGMACIAHGGSVVTEDVDVCIPFTLPNLERVLRALTGTPGVHYDSAPDSGYSVDNQP